jgi:MFS family permease
LSIVAVSTFPHSSSIPILFAGFYHPHPDRTVGSLVVQLLLIAPIAAALYAYLWPRFGRKATIIALLIGELISFLPLGIAIYEGVGELAREIYQREPINYSEWFIILCMYIDFWDLTICSLAGLLASATVCFVVLAIKSVLRKLGRQREHGGSAESPPIGPSPVKRAD